MSEEYFLPAAIFKKMYQLLTKKRKGELLCKEELQQQYSNSSSHSSTRLVCGPVATHKAGRMVQFMFQCHRDGGSVI